MRVLNEVNGFLGGGVRRHNNAGRGSERAGREKGIVHEGDVGIQGVACCEMELSKLSV